MPSPFIEIPVDTPSGERLVKVTNPEKTYFSGLPEGRGRKLDMVEYYLAVADGIVRALRERPTVLKRHPDGAEVSLRPKSADLLHHLAQSGGRWGLQTMCEGGGMANATVVERL